MNYDFYIYRSMYFLNLALAVDESSALHFTCFTPGERAPCIRWPQSWSGHCGEKNFTRARIQILAIQVIANTYTELS
jgi:hypothetical protein